jgi:hypothetical protein
MQRRIEDLEAELQEAENWFCQTGKSWAMEWVKRVEEDILAQSKICDTKSFWDHNKECYVPKVFKANAPINKWSKAAQAMLSYHVERVA